LVILTRAGILVRLPVRTAVHQAQPPSTDFEEFYMAAVCDICGKGPGFGKSVSHSHRRTNRRWDPNVQTVRAVDRPGGNRKRVNACTSCLKAGKVTRG